MTPTVRLCWCMHIDAPDHVRVSSIASWYHLLVGQSRWVWSVHTPYVTDRNSHDVLRALTLQLHEKSSVPLYKYHIIHYTITRTHFVPSYDSVLEYQVNDHWLLTCTLSVTTLSCSSDTLSRTLVSPCSRVNLTGLTNWNFPITSTCTYWSTRLDGMLSAATCDGASFLRKAFPSGMRLSRSSKEQISSSLCFMPTHCATNLRHDPKSYMYAWSSPVAKPGCSTS